MTAEGRGSDARRAAHLEAIAPLDREYYYADEELYRQLQPHLSAEGVVRARVRVEIASLRGLASYGLVDDNAVTLLEIASATITASEVAEEEEQTRHDIVALVRVLRRRAAPELRSFVHLGLTSSDIVDTANALRYAECTDIVLLPAIEELAAHWDRSEHAEVDAGLRLRGRAAALRRARDQLPGKISGAVGTYSALQLLTPDPRALERSVLASLGLHPAPTSTQIVPPEGWADLGHACITVVGVITDEARRRADNDPRWSATATRIETLWRSIVPRIVTVYADQISEHQRDHTNSASQRFFGELLAAVAAAASLAHAAATEQPISEHAASTTTVFGTGAPGESPA